MSKIKKAVKKFLQYKKYTPYFRVRYYFKNSVTINMENIKIVYITDTNVAKKWFYPRYDKGYAHEYVVSKLIYSYLNSGSVFLDIGANLGFFTVLGAKICNKKGSVHAFEMDPQFIPLINKSLLANESIGAVYLNCVAVTNENGKFMTYNPHQEGNPSTNRLEIDGSCYKKIYNQSMSITIDKYCQHNDLMPDLIKIDIEGAEALALQGMLETLRLYHPRIIIEVHPEHIVRFNIQVNELLQQIIDIGYKGWVIEEYRKKFNDDVAKFSILDMENLPSDTHVIFFDPIKK